MGFLDFFARRSQRERAIPGADPSDAGTMSVGSPSQQAGSGQTGSGGAFVTQSSPTIDARNAVGLRDDMLEILKRHGIDPMKGQSMAVDASSFPGLAEEIQGTLAGHGIQIPAVNWSPQGTPGIMQLSKPPDGADADDRLRKLEQLRDSGLITPEEFSQQRSRILGEL